MPELPEVETIVRSLRPHILGRKVSEIKVLLPKIIHTEGLGSTEDLIGQTITNIFRWGKNIVLEFSPNWYVRIHLKMTGQLLVSLPEEPIPKHTHVIFSLDGGKIEVRYRDIRQFGYIHIMTAGEWKKWRDGNFVGPDPLEISLPSFLARLAGKRGKIKSVLLNQAFLRGLGNIYVDEILHQAKIHPESSADHLSTEEATTLYQKMQQVLQAAIWHQGSSVSDYVDSSGKQGEYQYYHQVYGRANLPCRQCGTRIERIRVSGRSTCFCPKCQRRR
ncbi:MAG: bifunctional DNA-formamidopyrimidine glycosylase/DNA-(apurinic or apyrimidinic site) lyase [bacterium]|nr:bifunctional DNA-formamidopyrimidine glycosylase/DNA-(apurinic or apyrimidinic site) lyase [bacterium]